MARSEQSSPRRANRVRRESSNRMRVRNQLVHGRWDDVEVIAPTRNFRTGSEVE